MKTKQLLYLTLMTAGTFFISFKAQAQSETKKFSIGLGLEGGLPVGADTKAAYKVDGGITLRFAYHVGPGFVTLTSGLVGYYPNTAVSASTQTTSPSVAASLSPTTSPTFANGFAAAASYPNTAASASTPTTSPTLVHVFAVTAGSSSNSTAGQSKKASLQIPIKAGYKYVIHEPFFVMGEIGYSLFRSYFPDGNGNLASNSTGVFTYGPSVGVTYKALELSIKYEALSASGGTISNIGLRLGFNF